MTGLLYAYIGAAALVGLLIGVVTLAILWISQKVSGDIRDKTLDMISAYDDILEQRSRTLAETRQELLRLQKEAERLSRKEPAAAVETEAAPASGAALLNAAERIGTAAYRDEALSRTYHQIRGSFPEDPNQALAILAENAAVRRQGDATRLLAELPYETVYQLSILSEDEQLRLLRETLPREGLALLEDYGRSRRKFDAIAFYDYLQGAAAMEPQPPRLLVSPLYPGPTPQGVAVVVDPDICEGFQIEMDNTLYDYCIRRRELK